MPVSHSIRNLTSTPCRTPASDSPLRYRFVVEHDREPAQPFGQRHQPIGLGAADDIEGEQHVVGHTRVGEHFHFTQLLAGDADRARLHLQLAQRRDLVRLDVGAIGDAVLGKVRLHAANVVLHDVEVDGDSRGFEVENGGH